MLNRAGILDQHSPAQPAQVLKIIQYLGIRMRWYRTMLRHSLVMNSSNGPTLLALFYSLALLFIHQRMARPRDLCSRSRKVWRRDQKIFEARQCQWREH